MNANNNNHAGPMFLEKSGLSHKMIRRLKRIKNLGGESYRLVLGGGNAANRRITLKIISVLFFDQN